MIYADYAGVTTYELTWLHFLVMFVAVVALSCVAVGDGSLVLGLSSTGVKR